MELVSTVCKVGAQSHQDPLRGCTECVLESFAARMGEGRMCPLTLFLTGQGLPKQEFPSVWSSTWVSVKGLAMDIMFCGVCEDLG